VGESESEKSDLTKRHQKTGIKKTTTPHTREMQKAWPKNNNKNKTTKHTIEFSNNTRPAAQQAPRLFAAYSLCGRRRIPPKWSFPLGHRRARRTCRVATTRSSYATGNSESNNLLDAVFRGRKINQRVRPRQYSACPGAAPATVRGGSRMVGVPSSRRRSWCC
jgi:hypothetical protein